MTDENELIPPVKIGDILKDQETINSGKRGDGVVKYEGYIIFVNDCEKGDIVSFEITKVMNKMGIGRKIEEEE